MSPALLVRHPGRPAADALAEVVRAAKAHDPLAPVTVVVPTNAVGVAARRRLASGDGGPVLGTGPGLAAVGFLTVHRLAELLGAGALAGSGRRPVSTPVLATAVRAALADDPGVFAAVAQHPATEEALVAAHRELRDLSAGALARLAAASPRAADVVRLHRAAHAALRPRWYDEHDLLDAARAAVEQGAGDDLGHVVVHLPERLGRAAGALLGALGGRSPLTVVLGATGHPDADADLVAVAGRLGMGTEAEAALRALDTLRPTATRVLSATDPDDEVRAAVRVVVAAAERGVPLERTAVLHGSPEPYARIVAAHLEAAGLPANGVAVRPPTDRVAARTLLGLLALPAARYRRDAVLAVLAGAPVRGADGAPAPVERWEHVSRAAGVVGGLDQWRQRLTRYAALAEARAEVRAAHGDDGRLDAAEARDARELLALVEHVAGSLPDGPAPWSTWRSTLGRLLHRLLGGPAARAGWPDAEVRAADRLDALLDRLATLDGVGPAADPGPDRAAVERTIRLELAADLGRQGRLGEGVATGPLALGGALDLDVVVVVGMAEGTVPGHRRDDALLPDHERRATGGELALRGAGTGTQHRHLLAALAAAGGERVVARPRGELRRNADRSASRWLADLFGPAGAAATHEDELASHAAALLGDGPAATAAEHRVRVLHRIGDAAVPAAALAGDRAFVLGSALVEARRSAALTRFDGNLAAGPRPVPLPRLADGRPTSPTALARWLGCPNAYFVHQVLGVREVTAPEQVRTIAPTDYGTLVHAVLEAYVRDGIWREPDLHRAQARAAELAARAADDAEAAGIVGHPVFWRHRRQLLLADVAGFVAADHAWREAHPGTEVLAAELAFGSHDRPPVTVRTAAGPVHLAGSADRLDRRPDGTLVVLDYKTGKRDRYLGISHDQPLGDGSQLQLPAYALAARALTGDPHAPVEAHYWFVGPHDERTRIGYVVDDTVLATFADTVGAVVAGIDAGCFPARPQPTTRPGHVPCAACDPDGLGVAERDRQWQRKQADPAARPYLDALVTAAGRGGDDG